MLGKLTIGAPAFAVILVACGGSQPPIGEPGTMLQSRVITGHADRRGSWILPEAKRENLIYMVSNPRAVLSYSTGKIVGTIVSSYDYEGVCSDKSGNVFYVGPDSSVFEYAHGATEPMATLNLPGYAPSASGCASDPTTGNLAVTYYDFEPSGTLPDVAVFANAQGTPTVYQTGIASQYCTYDGEGNLFADGTLENDAAIAELPNGGSSFTVYPITKEIGGNPFSIFWDGKYLSVESIAHSSIKFSRVKAAGSTATVVGTVHLRGKLTHGSASWLLGDVLLVPYGANNVTRLGFWRYPKGGKPTQVFTQKEFGERLLFRRGLTVSIAGSH
jgi:hypothetical protein